MKNKIVKIIICSALIIFISGCKNNSDVLDNIPEQLEKYIYATNFIDGRKIHMTFDVKYNNESLINSINANKITYEEIKNNMQIYSTKDLEYILYKYDPETKLFGESDFYMMECNTKEGVNDIYILYSNHQVKNLCSSKIDDIDNVKMKITKRNFDNNKITIEIKDSSDAEYIYGDDYKIQIYDNTYKDITPIKELNFNSIGYTNKNDLIFKIDWTNSYGKLKAGDYRLLKKVIDSKNLEHYISVKFTIK